MKRINKIIKRARGSKWRLHKKDFWNEVNYLRKQKPCNCHDCSGGISKVYYTSAENIDWNLENPPFYGHPPYSKPFNPSDN